MRQVLKTKCTAFKDYLNNITKSQTFGTAYKIIKDKFIVNVLIHRILKDGGSYTNSFDESRREILLKNFYNDTLIDSEPIQIDEHDNIYNSDLNLLELEKVINNMAKQKVPGYDGITTDIIKYLFGVNSNVIYNIFNTISRIFTKIWKVSNICLIPKEGKVLTKWDSYRPITLVST